MFLECERDTRLTTYIHTHIVLGMVCIWYMYWVYGSFKSKPRESNGYCGQNNLCVCYFKPLNSHQIKLTAHPRVYNYHL